MILLIHRWIFGAPALYAPIDLEQYGIPECKQCHTHLRTGFVLSLMAHLTTGHGFHEDKSIETAIRMVNLVVKQRLLNARNIGGK